MSVKIQISNFTMQDTHAAMQCKKDVTAIADALADAGIPFRLLDDDIIIDGHTDQAMEIINNYLLLKRTK